MRTLTILAALLCIGNLVAAQELTRSNFPNTGDTFMLYLVQPDGAGEKSGGTSQTWDYSGQLQVQDSLERSYLNPANTPGADSFPGADMAFLRVSNSRQEIYDYYHVTDSVIQLIGQYTITNQSGLEFKIPLIFDDSAKVYEYPMGYNDSFEDTYLVEDTIETEIQNVFTLTQEISTHGDKEVKVDGIGDLQVAEDTFENVLRVINYSRDSTHQVIKTPNGNDTVNQIQETRQFFFYAADGEVPLMEVTYSTVETSDTTVNTEAVFINRRLKNASTTQNNSIEIPDALGKFLTYPNPVNKKLNITLDLAQPTPVQLEVKDLNGRQVIRRDYGRVSESEFRATLETGEWESGIYLINLSTKNGSKSRKVIVE